MQQITPWAMFNVSLDHVAADADMSDTWVSVYNMTDASSALTTAKTADSSVVWNSKGRHRCIQCPPQRKNYRTQTSLARSARPSSFTGTKAVLNGWLVVAWAYCDEAHVLNNLWLWSTVCLLRWWHFYFSCNELLKCGECSEPDRSVYACACVCVCAYMCDETCWKTP